MEDALDLLHNLRDFGWPLLVYALIAPVPTYLLPSRLSREERTSRLVLVGGIIAAIESVLFMGTSGSLILQVGRVHPVWGFYVASLAAALVVAATMWCIRAIKRNRRLLTLHDSEAQDLKPTGASTVGAIAVCLFGLAGALIWLVQIARRS